MAMALALGAVMPYESGGGGVLIGIVILDVLLSSSRAFVGMHFVTIFWQLPWLP